MKKFLSMLFAFTLVFSACTSSSDKEEANCENGTIYMVTDMGGINDKSFNESTYRGVTELVEEKDGVCSDYITSSKEADYKPNLTVAADKKPALVIAAGFLFEDAMREVADANPEQQFLLVDSPVGVDGTQVENVTSALFAEEQGSYLVGVAAAEKAKAEGYNKVGFIGGMEFDLIIKFEVGYRAGVASVDPEMEVLVEYVGDFNDTSLGKATANKMYNSGAYIIYHAAGNSGNGVIKEAQERYLNFKDGKADDLVWVIGVDMDQYHIGLIEGEDHSVVLTSMLKRVDVASKEISKMALDGTLEGGKIVVYDLENMGVGIPDENPNLDASIVSAVDAATKDILNGAVVVPKTREELE